MTTETPTRPIVRYHGGKWKLAPWIIGNFPPHRIYVEPFGGGGSVLLRKPRSYAEIYNDLDGEMVNLFRMVRDRSLELRRALELTLFSRDEFLDSYEPTKDLIEQARRTVVRSFMGFGSAAASGNKTGFRSNATRSGTTPAHDWVNFPSALVAVCERLLGVTIENKDAIEVMRTHDGAETLHYVDPPYVPSTRHEGNPYCKKGYRFEMVDADHRALAAVLNELKGAVIVSGYPSPLYNELFEGWERLENNGAYADGAKNRTEVLWMKNCDYGLFAK